MNADWIKRNGIAAVFFAAFLIFLGYDVWKLQRAFAKRREIETQLEQEKSRLQDLLRSRPFPSTDNVDILRNSRQQLDKLYAELAQTAAHPITTPELNRVQFRTLLTQKLNALNENAEANQVSIPPNFAFGFDEYLGVLPPDNRAVLQGLTKQLIVIERLCELLYTNKVSSIAKIGRDAITTPDEVSDPKLGPLYQNTNFELSITCTTRALQEFLNSLTKQKWFFAVKTVNVQAKTISVSAPGQPVPMYRPVPGFPAFGTMPTARTPDSVAPTSVEKSVLEVQIRLELIEIRASQETKPRRS